MIAVKWSRRGSWHLQAATGLRATLCGRSPVPGAFWQASMSLPGDEKTCERCAVIAAKRGLASDSGSDYGAFEGAPV